MDSIHSKPTSIDVASEPMAFVRAFVVAVVGPNVIHNNYTLIRSESKLSDVKNM